MDLYKALKIISGSKRYDFDGDTILTISDYYTGDAVRLDLSRLTEDILDELIVEDEDEEDDDNE